MEATTTDEGYKAALSEYVLARTEEALYRASLLSQTFIEAGLGPEDIIALHFEKLEGILPTYSYREQARIVSDAHQFLLEVMIAYGIKYREYLELRLSETIREAETRARADQERLREAERADREKDETLGLIAHELRTPLTAAMGNLDLAQRSVNRGQFERLPPLLGQARDALGRLSRLTAHLVEMNRGEFLSLECSPQDLRQLASQAGAWARTAAMSKGVDLRFELGTDPILVDGNDDALLSILGNLLSNAIRYTPRGGEVVLRVAQTAEAAEIEVRDTGIGIAPEDLDRIFEKFYRTTVAQSVERKGLGLGLSLVQQLVEAHDGRVEVESTPDQGSTFRVLMPVLVDTEAGE